MIIGKKQVETIAVVFLSMVVAVVFQQIYTSLAEQGISTGGPYDNAAAYPRGVAILMAFLLAIQVCVFCFADGSKKPAKLAKFSDLILPFSLLLIFAVYLGLLGHLGYHLTTPPMIISIMLLCGMRNLLAIVGSSVGISLTLAFLFERFLNVVLPGGIYRLNIPW